MRISNTLVKFLSAAALLGSLCVPRATAVGAKSTEPSAPKRYPLTPHLAGPWWTIAGDPDLGALTSPKQQPVDFGIWQAADGTWQLWSCIRGTHEPGKTRLFHRWEGGKLTDRDWTPKGIALAGRLRFGRNTRRFAGALRLPPRREVLDVLRRLGEHLPGHQHGRENLLAPPQFRRQAAARLRGPR